MLKHVKTLFLKYIFSPFPNLFILINFADVKKSVNLKHSYNTSSYQSMYFPWVLSKISSQVYGK